MEKFYTSVFVSDGKIYEIGYQDGKRFKKVMKYTPFLFINGDGEYRTIHNQPVQKIKFSSIYEAQKYLKRYKDVENMPIYGMTNFLYPYIYERYTTQIEYNPKTINVATIDIEARSDTGFPDIKRADKEITAITIRLKKKNYVFGCGVFVTTDPDTYYFKCKDEKELLTKFLNCWDRLQIDIITGWSIEFFDIPYLINRIKRIFGEDSEAVMFMSPWRKIKEKEVEFRGKIIQSYNIFGVSVLDYYQLYRKFTFGNEENYKLDFIAEKVTGQKKVDYSEYGSLTTLMEMAMGNYNISISEETKKGSPRELAKLGTLLKSRIKGENPSDSI